MNKKLVKSEQRTSRKCVLHLKSPPGGVFLKYFFSYSLKEISILSLCPTWNFISFWTFVSSLDDFKVEKFNLWHLAFAMNMLLIVLNFHAQDLAKEYGYIMFLSLKMTGRVF